MEYFSIPKNDKPRFIVLIFSEGQPFFCTACIYLRNLLLSSTLFTEVHTIYSYYEIQHIQPGSPPPPPPPPPTHTHTLSMPRYSHDVGMAVITSQYSGCTTLKLLATALQSQKIHHCNLKYYKYQMNHQNYDQYTSSSLKRMLLAKHFGPDLLVLGLRLF